MERTYVEEITTDPEERKLFQQEFSIESVTGLICERMEDQGISRAELAKRMGRSPGWVTQLLDGERNKTVRTLSDAFFALGRTIVFRDAPLADIFRRTSHELRLVGEFQPCVIESAGCTNTETEIELPTHNTPAA